MIDTPDRALREESARFAINLITEKEYIEILEQKIKKLEREIPC